MGMTLTQKILAAHAGLPEVKAGQLINAKLDIVLGNDITTPVAINEFERAGFDRVFDKEHIAIVLDHFSSHHFAHIGLPGRISDHRRTAADEANGPVPRTLHMSHNHHTQKMTDMQTVRRRIETDIKRNFFFRQ